MCLLRVFFDCLRAFENQRVEFLRGSAEDRHRQSVALGFVFNLAEGVDQFPVDLLTVAEVALCINDSHTQLSVCFSCFPGSVLRLVHGADVPGHGARDRVQFDIDQVGHVGEFLERVRVHARHLGECEDLIGVGAGILCPVDHGLCAVCDRLGDRSDPGSCDSRGSCQRAGKHTGRTLGNGSEARQFVSRTEDSLVERVQLDGAFPRLLLQLVHLVLHLVESGLSVV